MDTGHRRRVKKGSASITIAMITIAALLFATAIAMVNDQTTHAATSGSALAIPQPGPLDDSFYLPPSPLPNGKPGDILRWRPSIPLLNLTSANAWNVMYLSRNALGRPDAVTATVIVPKNIDPRKTPIVGFAVGTQGPAFACAPSKSIKKGLLYDQLAINDSLDSGFAVTITDYEGYSPRGTPTYMTGRSMGPAVIDAVRAAQRLPAAGLASTSKVVFQGYSQGGGAALWAAERQPSYAPELNLVGVVAGGVPADLARVAKGLDGGVGFGFLAFAAIGLDAAYPELDLDSFLNRTGRAEIARAKSSYCTADLLLREPFKKIGDLTTRNPLDTPRWRARLAENRLGLTPPKVPVLQYHAAADEIVDLAQADTLHKAYCAQGVRLQFNKIVSEHLTGIIAGNGASHEWIVDRLNDVPAPSNC